MNNRVNSIIESARLLDPGNPLLVFYVISVFESLYPEILSGTIGLDDFKFLAAYFRERLLLEGDPGYNRNFKLGISSRYSIWVISLSNVLTWDDPEILKKRSG